MNIHRTSIAILLSVLLSASAQIAETDGATKSLGNGVKAPTAKLVSNDGTGTSLAELAAETPVVVVFYRGHWCPLCMSHLKQLESAKDDIKAAGYQLIAVAPDSPEQIAKTQRKFDIPLYADPETKLG